ncbi:MAG TPA: M28 family peptidase [Gemmatimonadaceae bacterium]|nr:M28 family peptidase [Gemmatimonadaceae bacterium]
MGRFALRVALLTMLCALALRVANHLPAVAPATSAAGEFSAERAMRHVRAIAARPHPIGSAENRRVAEYIMGELATLGLAPQVQEATAIGTRYAAAGRVRNVVARVPGTQPGGPAVLLMAHYDGVPAGPGAGDDASGSSVLLETLRALRASPPLRHDVIALFADGEEAGLLGAAAFVREHPWARDVAFTMNFEARGTTGPSLMFETGAGNLDGIRVLRRVGGARATSLSTFVYRQLPNDTDLSETAVLDRPAMNFAFIGGVNRYHTAQDDVEHLNPRSIQDHGQSALALTRELAGNPLPREATGDAVFFDMPLLGLIAYPEGWSPVFALLILLPLGRFLARLRRTEPRWLRGVVLGVTGATVSVALGAVLGMFAANALRSVHEFIGSGAPMHSGLYAAAVALLAFSLAAAVHALLRRWAPAVALQAGGVVFLTLLALLTAFLAPGISFVFIWPAIVVAGALAEPGRAEIGEAILWIASALAILVLAPITYLMGVVALGLDATGAAVVAVFTTLGAWLLAHTLEMWEGRPWRTPATAFAASLALFSVGAATVRTSDEHPVGSSIGYGVDADSNTAYLGVQASTRGAASALRAQMASDPSVRPPAWFARYFSTARMVPPPGSSIPKASVSVIADSTSGSARHLTVRVVPGEGTQVISLRADSGMVQSTSVDGRPVATGRYRFQPRGRWNMEYHAPDPGGFEVAFVLATGRPFGLSLVSQLPGIPRVPGLDVPRRADGVIPIQRGDFTAVHQRVTLP